MVKPAEQTPLTALALAALLVEAGVPKGVVNVVNGFGPSAGTALTHHPDVAKISFTGSLEVSRKIFMLVKFQTQELESVERLSLFQLSLTIFHSTVCNI